MVILGVDRGQDVVCLCDTGEFKPDIFLEFIRAGKTRRRMQYRRDYSKKGRLETLTRAASTRAARLEAATAERDTSARLAFGKPHSTPGTASPLPGWTKHFLTL